jgi:hypothetical protein
MSSWQPPHRPIVGHFLAATPRSEEASKSHFDGKTLNAEGRQNADKFQSATV